MMDAFFTRQRESRFKCFPKGVPKEFYKVPLISFLCVSASQSPFWSSTCIIYSGVICSKFVDPIWAALDITAHFCTLLYAEAAAKLTSSPGNQRMREGKLMQVSISVECDSSVDPLYVIISNQPGHSPARVTYDGHIYNLLLVSSG